MPTKGHKSQAGVGDIYETPKVKLNLTVTETGKAELDQKAAKLGISKSELVERFARDTIPSHEEEAVRKLKAIQTVIEKWIEVCTPERRSLARWKHTWSLLQELIAIISE